MRFRFVAALVLVLVVTSRFLRADTTDAGPGRFATEVEVWSSKGIVDTVLLGVIAASAVWVVGCQTKIVRQKG